jgi:putative iron-regulated protein
MLLAAVMLGPVSARAETHESLQKELALNYTKVALASYRDSLAGAEHLLEEVTRFLGKPTEDSLEKTRGAWIKARQPYLRTECLRYYGGPIDDMDGPEGLLNSWPVDEVWLESGASKELCGIIENTQRHPEITALLLRDLNQKEGEKNISCGWHAIEFLLWGADEFADSGGRRPPSDFTEGPLASRRGAALRASCELLVECLRDLVQLWDDSPEAIANYRVEFLDSVVQETTRRILTGMFFLSSQEMAGERINVALETRSQEDEQSCFSDTTIQDIEHDLAGIQSLWSGHYVSIFVAEGDVQGTGVQDLAKAVDAGLAQSIDATLQRTAQLVKTIPAPFDQAVLGEDEAPGRRALLETMESLESLAQLLQTLGERLAVQMTNQSASLDG